MEQKFFCFDIVIDNQKQKNRDDLRSSLGNLKQQTKGNKHIERKNNVITLNIYN